MAATPNASAKGLRQRAEQLAARLPPLLVDAERIAATVAQGVHGRRLVGTGDAFWQFRRYQPGDAATAVDWRQSAKRTALFVRQNEWEAAESVWLWRDGSPSMDWHSEFGPADKRERADLLLMALAALLIRGGERVALLGRDRYPTTGRATLERLAQALLLDDAPGASLPPNVELPRHAQVVMLGDFLSPLPEIEASVRGFAASGVKGHLLQVLDPAEQDLPFTGRARFHGLEGEGSFTVSRVETLKQDWQRRLATRHDALKTLAQRTGWNFSVHRTDRSPQSALLALFGALAGGLPH